MFRSQANLIIQQYSHEHVYQWLLQWSQLMNWERVNLDLTNDGCFSQTNSTQMNAQARRTRSQMMKPHCQLLS